MTFTLVWLGSMLLPAQLMAQTPAPANADNAGEQPDNDATMQELKAARQAVSESQDSGDAHLRLARALSKLGRNREAAQEYLTAANVKQSLYVAYHELIQVTDDAAVLDDAIEQLNQIKEKDPKDLMLRVALSEVYEKHKKYHEAAKALVELQLANAVPPSYSQRLNLRVHYLLAKGKQAHDRQGDVPVATDEELDVVPSPPPSTSLRKGLTASKIKDSKELKGMGHVPLLP